MMQIDQQLKTVAQGLIQRVMNRLDGEPETEELFLRWADGFSKLKPHNPELWDKLRTHIRWPI